MGQARRGHAARALVGGARLVVRAAGVNVVVGGRGAVIVVVVVVGAGVGRGGVLGRRRALRAERLRAPGARAAGGREATARLVGGCAELRGLARAQLVHHGREDRAGVGQQAARRVELGENARVEHENAVRVDDGVEAVRNGDNGAVREGGADSVLDEAVGLVVDRAGGLVEQEHFGLREHRPGEAEQLALALRKVLAVLGHLAVEAAHLFNRAGHLALLERLPDRVVVVLAERVEVGAHGATEDDRVLRDDGDLGAQVVQADLGDVHAVDFDRAGAIFVYLRLNQAQQREEHAGLAAAGAAHHADAHATLDGD
mmetsp:Transcript_22087/g.70542  ORF Transcript_22087/g.70542 Transcript_22087/m.70542 type:complete len:314 (+) Transcript_22087:197-1138(+)